MYYYSLRSNLNDIPDPSLLHAPYVSVQFLHLLHTCLEDCDCIVCWSGNIFNTQHSWNLKAKVI